MTTIRLLDGKQFLSQHAPVLRSSCGLIDEEYVSRRDVLLCEGDFHLPSSLHLDWDAAWNTLEGLAGLGVEIPPGAEASIVGIVVLGDLVIDGALINANMDGGPFLHVAGHLVARAVLSGGASIIVDGSAYLREAAIGWYNHGGLQVRQRLYTTLFVCDDHWMSATEVDATVSYDRREALACGGDSDSGDDEDEDSCDDEDAVPAALRPFVVPEVSCYSDLRLRLARDLPVVQAHRVRELPPPPRFAAPTTAQACIERAQADEWFSLKLVPPALADDEALLLALVRVNPRAYDSLGEGRHLLPAFMLASLDSGSARCLEYLENLRSEDPQAARQEVARKALSIDVAHAERIPGHCFDQALLDFADTLYAGQPAWATIRQRHGLDFWTWHLEGRYVLEEAQDDPGSPYRLSDGLQKAWQCFWTEDFLLAYVQAWGGSHLRHIPASSYTQALFDAVNTVAPEHVPAQVRQRFGR